MLKPPPGIAINIDAEQPAAVNGTTFAIPAWQSSLVHLVGQVCDTIDSGLSVPLPPLQAFFPQGLLVVCSCEHER